jgi:exodeoxyribonuclease VII large subunit
VVSELTFRLRRALAARLQRLERTHQTLRLRLEARDVRRQHAMLRATLGSVDGRLAAAVRRRVEHAGAVTGALTGRLDSLSPLAVLARGYAVCWNDDRTLIVSDASAVSPGDRVRVTLASGEIACDVRSVDDDAPRR